MAKPVNDGSGTVIIPASDVNTLLIKAAGLGPSFYVTMGKVKVLTDGSLEGKYTFSTEGSPEPPPADTPELTK